jgi:hypothetical protein
MHSYREGLMEASVFLGGGWLDGSGDEASQLRAGDAAHLPCPHEADLGAAHAAALQAHHPGVLQMTCCCTIEGSTDCTKAAQVSRSGCRL